MYKNTTGFLISINDREKKYTVDKGVVCISVDNTKMMVSGIDTSIEASLNWGNTNLEIGDVLKIKIAEIDTVAPPINMQLTDRNKLLEDYYHLKDVLTKEGIL